MKNFTLSVWALCLTFFIVMAVVVIITSQRSSNSTGIDPAQITRIRQQSS